MFQLNNVININKSYYQSNLTKIKRYDTYYIAHTGYL